MGVCDPFRQNLKRYIIQQLYNRFEQLSSDYWFIGIGKATPWVSADGVTNDNSPPRSLDSFKDDTDFWRTLVAIKRIFPENVSLVVRRYDWEKGQVYDAYRDNTDLFDDESPAKFYVLVDEERVYKCIDNANGVVSSVSPTHTDSQIRELSDGYRWKFLYQIPESKRKFLIRGSGEIASYMPVEFVDELQENDERILQWGVQEDAVRGSIDFVEVDPVLRQKFVSSNRVLLSSSANEFVASSTAGSSTVYLGGSYLIPQNGFYNGMVLRIDSGLGSGQQRVIDSYTYNSNGTGTVTLSNALNFTITGGTGTDASRYSILPRVYVEGDGEANDNSLNTYINTADFRVIFETTSTSGGLTGPRYISSVEPNDPGKNYTYAELSITGYGLSIVEGTTGNLSDLLTPVLSPYDGHGSNPVLELGASGFLIVTDFSADESSKISVRNDIRQFGLLRNPELAAKTTYLTFRQPGVNGSFVAGSTVTQGLTGFDGTTGFDPCSATVVSWSVGASGSTGSSVLRVTDITNGDFSLNGVVSGFDIIDVDERLLVGSEYQNLQALTLVPLGTAGTSFSAAGTDYTQGYYAYGAGNTSDRITPSRSIGKIYSWQPNTGTNLVGTLLLENPHGTWKVSEKVEQFSHDLGFIGGINGKITDISTTYENEQTTYDLTSKYNVQYNGINTFTDSSFVMDSRVIGASGSGTVIEWVPATGATTGILTLIDQAGTFAIGQTVPYTESTGTSGASITEIVSVTEVAYRTGEVDFIQNIRPIDRSGDQREEIKFLIEL